ncbi:response regulator transcription factor [Saccharopolyspora halophila]|uniref:Sensory transduction protein RegX3 n=1 Tax=Saccharopolyspora halophila TaxID=405551 RepID=A0ABP5TXL2_9PSEU
MPQDQNGWKGSLRVLLVEDDDRVAGAISSSLGRQGYVVERACTGAQALAAAPVDLVLLDLGLPDVEGIELCQRLRERDSVPMIMVTARGQDVDKVKGLRAGADDYLVKPFALAELLARVQAVLRRSATWRRRDESGSIILDDVVIDLAGRSVTVGDQPVNLTRKEFDILAMLASDPGVVFPRDRIMVHVWDAPTEGASRTLDVHVAMLRSKLGRPGLVETVRSVGYRLRPQHS